MNDKKLFTMKLHARTKSNSQMHELYCHRQATRIVQNNRNHAKTKTKVNPALV